MTYFRNWLLVSALAVPVALRAQGPTTPAPDPVLLTLGNRPVTVSEFRQVYQKNLLATDSAASAGSMLDYLKLFVNYKLKVRAAEARGLDTTQAFREELATYRQQSAQAYLTDKKVTEALIREAYDRMREELNVAHILVACAPDAAPADTLKAYLEAVRLRERIQGGEKFAEVAKSNSKDPYAAQNGGVLGWMTGLQMVYPFETAAYKTPKGQLSTPVRTKFGYHLIQVLDRRPAQGKVTVAHILARFPTNASEADKTAAKNRIDEAHLALQRGEPWERAVKQYSDDATSRTNGGQLRPFGSGEMVGPFEEAAFALKRPGAYSAPFQTQFGWHIVRLVEREPLPPFEEASGQIRQRVLADSRSQLSKAVTVERLKRENAYAPNAAVLSELVSRADSRLSQGTWQYAPRGDALENRTLFFIGKREYKVGEFLGYLQPRQQPRAGTAPDALMRTYIEAFANEKNLAYEEELLETKNPEFRALMQEYRDGILLFQVMEDNVWGKSLTDSLGQQRYYEQHRAEYQWPERAVAQVWNAKDAATLTQVQRLLTKNPYPLNRTLPDLRFARNQVALTDAHREQLFDLVVVMAKNPGYVVEISGHADTSEPDSLSAARLRNAVRYLTSNGGIALTRIIEVDEGKFKPVSTSDRDKNRRIGVVFYTNEVADVVRQFNEKTPDRLRYEAGTFKKGDNALLDGATWKAGKQTLPQKNGRVVQLDVARIEPARPKTFEEARGAVINDYQGYLETVWLTELRRQYPVVFNDEEVRKLK
jgi:peptidyl-prolyl cis-trans isomerase SurA